MIKCKIPFLSIEKSTYRTCILIVIDFVVPSFYLRYAFGHVFVMGQVVQNVTILQLDKKTLVSYQLPY